MLKKKSQKKNKKRKKKKYKRERKKKGEREGPSSLFFKTHHLVVRMNDLMAWLKEHFPSGWDNPLFPE